MNNMISVIVTSYNKGLYIKECLNSIINNSYKNLEIIVIDDCSTDNSIDIIKSFDDQRIRFYKNDTNIGAGASRQRGIEYSNGQYISFVDADDFLDADFYQTLINAISDCDIVYSKYKVFSNGKTIKIVYNTLDKFDKKSEFLLNLFQYNLQFINASLIKKSLFIDYGIKYNSARFVEDTPTSLCLNSVTDRIKLLDYYGYNYRIVNNSLIHTHTKTDIILYVTHNMIDSIEWIKKRDEQLAKELKEGYKNIFITAVNAKALDDTDFCRMGEIRKNLWLKIKDYYDIDVSKLREMKKIICKRRSKVINFK